MEIYACLSKLIRHSAEGILRKWNLCQRISSRKDKIQTILKLQLQTTNPDPRYAELVQLSEAHSAPLPAAAPSISADSDMILMMDCGLTMNIIISSGSQIPASTDIWTR